MALKRIKVNNTQYDINDARINGIVDNLTSTDTDKVLSANQGKVLKGLVDTKTSNVGTITGITMNGSSKGTSGIVDLGTVITAHQDISGKANTSDLAKVATSGSYNDLTDKPTIDTALSTTSTNAVQNKVINSSITTINNTLSNKMDISDYVIDSSLSSSSWHPVQNKVVTAALNKKSTVSSSYEDETLTITIE